MNYILVIWTVVAFNTPSYKPLHEYDWRPIGGFLNVQRCEEAARQLGKKAAEFRCLQV